MNMWVLLARQRPPMGVKPWTPPDTHVFPFSPGLWDRQGLSAECRAGNTLGIKPNHLHPAGCKKEVICGLVLLNGDLTPSGE